VDQEAVTAPRARAIPKVSVIHGERRQDDFHWLRDKSDPETIAYLQAENAYTAAMMKDTEALQEQLYQEMLARIKETDSTVPYRRGAYYYYSRTEQSRQYPIYCRRRGSVDAAEQVILDVNALAAGQPFMAIGAMAVSDEGAMLAYSTDNTGFREYTLVVKDLASGELLPLRVDKTGSVAWAADNRTLFYTVEDAAKRQYRVYRHTLGGDQHRLVYEEGDERFRAAVRRSRSRAYLFLTSASHTTTEVRYLASGDPAGVWALIAAREQDHEYDADHRGDRFYIRSNLWGRNFAVARAPAADPRREHWQVLIPHRPAVMISGLDLFAGHMVIWEREGGLQYLRVHDFAAGEDHRLEFPEPAYALAPEPNAEFDTSVFRYGYQSLVTPPSVFDYDMTVRQARLLKQQEVSGGWKREDYICERLVATAADGVQIPMSVLRHAATRTPNDILLYGYGAYGVSIPASFNSNRFSLVDRGFVFAIAHVRGGGELGKAWHDQGRMKNKRNTFTDFLACAEHLLAAGYAAPGRLYATGGSAGGLLLGAVVNMRPDLFYGVVSHVPFVDVINTMLDESLPLTVGEFEEWGNPKIREDYDYIRSYCPYSNLETKAYPAMLLKTSLHDSQVMYWEPAKYVARLRARKTDSNLLLLQTNMAAGHGGASGRYDYLREIAFDYAFLLKLRGAGLQVCAPGAIPSTPLGVE
jgi:oligopeptidase B